MKKKRCPGQRDMRQRPFYVHASCFQDDRVKPRARCLDCGSIFAVTKDGLLHKHWRYP